MYKVEIKTSASKELQLIPHKDFLFVDKTILSLAENPRPSNCKKLAGEKNLWRLRKGNYRIIYMIEDKLKIIAILKVKHRKDVYR